MSHNIARPSQSFQFQLEVGWMEEGVGGGFYSEKEGTLQ